MRFKPSKTMARLVAKHTKQMFTTVLQNKDYTDHLKPTVTILSALLWMSNNISKRNYYRLATEQFDVFSIDLK